MKNLVSAVFVLFSSAVFAEPLVIAGDCHGREGEEATISYHPTGKIVLDLKYTTHLGSTAQEQFESEWGLEQPRLYPMRVNTDNLSVTRVVIRGGLRDPHVEELLVTFNTKNTVEITRANGHQAIEVFCTEYLVNRTR